MESLALVVSILVSICFFSGPIGLFLTSRMLTKVTTNPFTLLLRRTVLIINGLLGSALSSFFLFGPIPLFLKAISLISLVLNVWAIDREFGGNLTSYLRRTFKNRPSRDKDE